MGHRFRLGDIRLRHHNPHHQNSQHIHKMTEIKDTGLGVATLTGNIHRLMRALDEEEFDNLVEAVGEKVTLKSSLASRLQYERWPPPRAECTHPATPESTPPATPESMSQATPESTPPATPRAPKRRAETTLTPPSFAKKARGATPQSTPPATSRAPKRRAETTLTPPALAKRARDGFVDVGRDRIIHGIDTPHSPAPSYILVSSDDADESMWDDESMWCADMNTDESSPTTMYDADGEWDAAPRNHFVSTLVIPFSKCYLFKHMSSLEVV